VTLIGLLVLTVARFLLIFDVTLGSNDGISVIARLLASFVPHYLAFMLPFATYWGCYSLIRGMAVNYELAMLQASGISLRRIVAPLIVLGICVTGINLAVVGWLEPLGRYSYRGLIYTLEKESFYLKAREGTFMKVGSKTVLINDIRSDRRSFDPIFIFEPLGERGTKTIIANRGELIFSERNSVLRLFDGHQLKITDREDANSAERLDFTVLDLPLNAAITTFRARGDDEQELLLPELLSARQLPADTTPGAMSAELNRKLVIVLTSLFMPMLAASLAVINPRRKNIYQAPVVLLIIVVYHQYVEFGARLVERNGFHPYIAIWPVFVALGAASLFLFHIVSQRPGTLDEYVSEIGATLAALPARLFARAISGKV